jgi:hypothetical protein
VSRPRFLVDQDFNEHIIKGTRRLEPGIEFLLAREAGLERASDSEVLAWAAAQGWIVLSHDVNTMTASAIELVASGKMMRGLLIARQLAPVGSVIDSLILLWAASEAEEYADRVTYLPF